MKKTLLILLVVLLVIALILAVIEHEPQIVGDMISNRMQTAEKEERKTDLTDQIPRLSQYPALPTGCESTAAAMVLQFYGETVSPEEFAGSWLSCSECFYTSENILYGPDPEKYFVGDPFSANGYGCYAPAIVRAINEKTDSLVAEQINGDTLDGMYRKYVSRGEPLLVWVTVSMKESKAGNSWSLSDGRKFTWISGEHCMVFSGSDDRFFYFVDPQSGSAVGYEKELSEQRFRELGAQAVGIIRK